MTTRDTVPEHIDAALEPHIRRGEVLGLTWLVAVRGDVHTGALGHLDAERTRPAAVDSIFRISSMTKPITAATALTLVDDDSLALDAAVDAMAGLHLGAGPPAPAVPPEPDEWIRRLGTLPLQYQPGERWLYHTGADVLGVLVARAAGAPFADVTNQAWTSPAPTPVCGSFAEAVGAVAD